MSRSYKKTSCFTMKYRFSQKLSNRRFRKNRNIEDTVRKNNSGWEVLEYRSIVSKYTDPELYEKGRRK